MLCQVQALTYPVSINFRLEKHSPSTVCYTSLITIAASHSPLSPPTYTSRRPLLLPSLGDLIFLLERVVLASFSGSPAGFFMPLHWARLTRLSPRLCFRGISGDRQTPASTKEDAVFIYNQFPVLSCPSFPSAIKEASAVRYE